MAAERLEKAKLREALEPGCGESRQLVEDSLAGRPAGERRLLPDQALGLGNQPEAELILEPDGAQETEWVVVEDTLGDGAEQLAVEIGATAERVDELAAAEWNCESIDREVTGGEVGLDRPALERGEVDGSGCIERNAPAAVNSRKRKDRSPRAPHVGPSRPLGLGTDDVQVDDRHSEELVPHGAADDPGVLPGENLGRKLPGARHRRPCAAHAMGSS